MNDKDIQEFLATPERLEKLDPKLKKSIYNRLSDMIKENQSMAADLKFYENEQDEFEAYLNSIASKMKAHKNRFNALEMGIDQAKDPQKGLYYIFLEGMIDIEVFDAADPIQSLKAYVSRILQFADQACMLETAGIFCSKCTLKDQCTVKLYMPKLFEMYKKRGEEFWKKQMEEAGNETDEEEKEVNVEEKEERSLELLQEENAESVIEEEMTEEEAKSTISTLGKLFKSFILSK